MANRPTRVTNTIVVENAAGAYVPITVDSATQFFFRQPRQPGGGCHTHRDRALVPHERRQCQVDRSNGTVSVSPVDITTAGGLSTLTSALVAATPVKVYGTPQADGTLRAYVLMYFTGTQPGE